MIFRYVRKCCLSNSHIVCYITYLTRIALNWLYRFHRWKKLVDYTFSLKIVGMYKHKAVMMLAVKKMYRRMNMLLHDGFSRIFLSFTTGFNFFVDTGFLRQGHGWIWRNTAQLYATPSNINSTARMQRKRRTVTNVLLLSWSEILFLK